MIAAGLTASAASASAVDFNITGFIRQEIAVSITDEAYNHKAWNPAIDRSVLYPSYTGALDANNTPIGDTTIRGLSNGVNNLLPAGTPLGVAATGNGCADAANNFFFDATREQSLPKRWRSGWSKPSRRITLR